MRSETTPASDKWAPPAPEPTLDDRLGELSEKRAVFILRALLIAGHVNPWIMEKAIDLARTVSYE